MQLIYFSPVRWSSFAQRPHKFVEWFNKKTSGNVVWVEPYPTRLPGLSDFKSIKRASVDSVGNNPTPSWLKVVSARSLPVEPIPFSNYLNALFWNDCISDLERFAKADNTILVIGKPSSMAIQAVKTLRSTISIYDAMDNFPSFYSGLSRWSIAKKEKKLVELVDKMFVSSTELKLKWDKSKTHIVLIRNGLDVDLTPPLREKRKVGYVTFGYIGTVAKWFDWDWVINLAKLQSRDLIKIYGPVFNSPPNYLPSNIELYPAVAHSEALMIIQNFDVGLIPFKINELTKYVDPIKYYEYKVAGLPILSTSFGEMLYRKEEGVILADDITDMSLQISETSSYVFSSAERECFLFNNSWQSRFDSMNLFERE